MMSEDLGKSGRRSCFLVCVSLLVLIGTVLGFIAGLLVGGLLAKHGQFTSQGRIDGTRMVLLNCWERKLYEKIDITQVNEKSGE